MKTESEQMLLLFTGITAILTGQVFIALVIAGFMYTWEDAKWPAFDCHEYDRKMMNGPLKPWDKGN